MLGQMMEPVEMEISDEQKPLPKKPWAVSGHNNERKHNIINSLYLQAKDLEELVVARFERYKLIEEKEPMAEEYLVDDAEYVSSPTAPPPVLPRRQSARRARRASRLA